MKIFTNKVIDENELDYSKWETFNGDYVDVSMVSSTYLERSMDMLEQYMEKYPKHSNYKVWLRYLESLEDELDSREREDLEEYAAL